MTKTPASHDSPEFQKFFYIWMGQLVSITGSAMTAFALGVWIFEATGSVTRFALVFFFTQLPGILVTPLAGALADRLDRRLVMIASDVFAIAGTLGVVVLRFSGALEPWHVYAVIAVYSIANAFQWPAYSASITLLVPKRHLGRANGLVQTAQSASRIVAPLVAGLLLATIDIQGILLIDLVTFVVALATLLTVRFPRPGKGTEPAGQVGLWRDLTFGWRYIRQRPGLVALLLFFAAMNFSLGLAQVLVTPLILGFTETELLGAALSSGGVGMLCGSLVMSTWGGPRRRVDGVLGFALLTGTSLALLGLRPSPVLVSIALFMFFFGAPVVNGCTQAIWQTKVKPQVQGRVFAVRRMIAWSTLPLAYLAAGPLADNVFEPLLVEGGPLVDSFGPLLGVGPGRGIGLLFMVMGFAVLLGAAVFFSLPRLRHLEKELPDQIHDDSSDSMILAPTG